MQYPLGLSYCVPLCSSGNAHSLSLKPEVASAPSTLSPCEQGVSLDFQAEPYSSRWSGRERKCESGLRDGPCGDAVPSQGVQTRVLHSHAGSSAGRAAKENRFRGRQVLVSLLKTAQLLTETPLIGGLACSLRP